MYKCSSSSLQEHVAVLFCDLVLLYTDAAATYIYTLSLHDALPILSRSAARIRRRLYAQWGKVEMLAGEFFKLTDDGLYYRDQVPDPIEVGDKIGRAHV